MTSWMGCSSVQRLDLAARFLCDRDDPNFRTEFAVSAEGPVATVILCEFLPDVTRFTFGPDVLQHDGGLHMVTRFAWGFRLFTEYARLCPNERGSVLLNTGDCGVVPGLSYNDFRPEAFVVPDCNFISSRGYKWKRTIYSGDRYIPWDQRKPVAYWRGSTTGHPTDPSLGWRSLPRVRLSEIAATRPDLLDIGISRIAQVSQQAADEIRSSGLLRPYASIMDLNQYKYHIDIDGNTSAWQGPFERLFTGGPLLKVASPRGLRMWYYDRLKPWVNYVPVAADLSDLIENVEWLRSHDEQARLIGERGWELADSLNYEAELRHASRTITAAIRYFNGRPELSLVFGAGREDDESCLTDGWYSPGAGCVLASGGESHIALPRPVAISDFVLEMEIGPSELIEVPGRQRLSVAANGELVLQADITERRVVQCTLECRLWQDFEQLSVALLHPDAVRIASPMRPLDDRMASVALYNLTLSPVPVYVRRGPQSQDDAQSSPSEEPQAMLTTASDTAAAQSPTSRQAAVMQALYGRDIWQGYIPSRPSQGAIQGWNGQWGSFVKLLREAPSKIFIDVGVWKGQSSVHVALLIQREKMDGCVISVDTFLGSPENWSANHELFERHMGRPDLFQTFIENVYYNRVTDVVVPMPQTSLLAANIMRNRGIMAGMIHIDASHAYDDVIRDCVAYWPLVEPGGYMVGDDYGKGHPGVVKAADEFAAKLGLQAFDRGAEMVGAKAKMTRPAAGPARAEIVGAPTLRAATTRSFSKMRPSACVVAPRRDREAWRTRHETLARTGGRPAP